MEYPRLIMLGRDAEEWWQKAPVGPALVLALRHEEGLEDETWIRYPDEMMPFEYFGGPGKHTGHIGG